MREQQVRAATLHISMNLRRLADELLDYPLAEAQPRTIKIGKTFQARAGGRKQVLVPCIRLAGQWLAEAGFSEGDTLQVSVSKVKSGSYEYHRSVRGHRHKPVAVGQSLAAPSVAGQSGPPALRVIGIEFHEEARGHDQRSAQHDRAVRQR